MKVTLTLEDAEKPGEISINLEFDPAIDNVEGTDSVAAHIALELMQSLTKIVKGEEDDSSDLGGVGGG